MVTAGYEVGLKSSMDDMDWAREWSPNIVRRLEEACSETLLAPGFPAEILDDEAEAAGREVGRSN